jgi:hypothetical protein
MSDVSVEIGALKISDDVDELPKYEESEVGPDDSASKISIASSATEVNEQLLKMAMKKIQELENKIDELNEIIENLKQAGGSPLKRKKKDAEFNTTMWSTQITETGYFKANGSNNNVFSSNAARLAYIKMLMDFFNTSDFSTNTTFEELFTKVGDKYPKFQSLLDAVPVPSAFQGCNLIEQNFTSKYVKVAPKQPETMAAMSMAKSD